MLEDNRKYVKDVSESIRSLLQSKSELSLEVKQKRAADIAALLQSPGWKWVDGYIQAKIDYMSNLRNIKDGESHIMVTTVRKRQTIIAALSEFRYILNTWVKQAEKAEKFRSKEE